MTPQAFTILLEYLPLYAQEGHYRTAMPRVDVLGALQAVLPKDAAECLVAMTERLLVLCAALDQQALQQDEWCFVSFPARLCALSLLRSLAEPGQALFPSDFWDSSPYQHENTLNAQHEVLSWLEKQRLKYAPRTAPIRYCAVSAAVIRLAGKFWLHRRESQRIRDGNGEYVLPGGRSVFADLDVLSDLPFTERLRLLSEAGQLPLAARAQTLKRELQEEIGWLFEQDYFLGASRVLPVKDKLSGASSNFSYTRYFFTLFEIELTWAGFFKLFLSKKAHSGQFAEFSPEELRAGKNAMGQTAYLDILDDAMVEVPDSLAPFYRFDKPAQAVTLPLEPATPIRQGNARHENTLLDAGRLNVEQCNLLGLLGAHGKGLEIIPCKEVELLPYGWVRLDQTLHKLASGLAEQLRETGILEVFCGEYLRLSLNPNYLFFDARLFSYHLDEKARTIIFTRHEQNFSWATVKAQNLSLPISNTLLNAIHDLNDKGVSFSKNKTLEALARAAFETPGKLASIGLKKFLRLENKQYRLTINAE